MRIDAVLPVPGPPVISDRRWANALRTPRVCSSVSPSPRAARAGVAQAVAGLAGDQLLDALGQLGLELGGLGAVDPLLLADEVAGLDELVDLGLADVRGAEQLVGGGQQQVQRHAGAAAALGLGESVEDRRAGALAAVGGRAELRAIRSAIRNPTPNTLVSSYGRSATTRCAPSP